MARVQKVLGQLNPTASVMGDLYTCPAGANTVVSSMMICNQSNAIITFSVIISVNGESLNNKQYIYNGMPLGANDTFSLEVGLTFSAGDKVKVLTNSGNVSFNLFGQESTS